MGTTRTRLTPNVRVLALVGAVVALLGAVAVPSPTGAQDDGQVPDGCLVLETYPPQVVCDPGTGGGNGGSDDPVCSSPTGEVDCGPVPGGAPCPGIEDPNGGCSVPGDPGPGGGGGCDPVADPSCGDVIDVGPPIVIDPGDGDGEAPPCPAEWRVGDGCVIPIGTLPGDENPVPIDCDPAAGKDCWLVDPLPIDGGGVDSCIPAGDDFTCGLPDPDPCADGNCDPPVDGDDGSVGDPPVDDGGGPVGEPPIDDGDPDDTVVCGDDGCIVPPPPPIDGGTGTTPPGDDEPITEAGPWVSVRRLGASAESTGGDAGAGSTVLVLTRWVSVFR